MKTYEKFDIVTNGKGSIGIIIIVAFHGAQPATYSVKWIIGNEKKVAWFKSSELKMHFNIIECDCMKKLIERERG